MTYWNFLVRNIRYKYNKTDRENSRLGMIHIKKKKKRSANAVNVNIDNNEKQFYRYEITLQHTLYVTPHNSILLLFVCLCIRTYKSVFPNVFFSQYFVLKTKKKIILLIFSEMLVLVLCYLVFFFFFFKTRFKRYKV